MVALEEVESRELMETRLGSTGWDGVAGVSATSESVVAISSSRCSRSALSLLALEWDMAMGCECRRSLSVGGRWRERGGGRRAEKRDQADGE